MNILCRNREGIPLIDDQILIDNKLKRDLGLTNVYNISNTFSYCLEDFKSPLYTMVGTSKPFSGTTSGCSGYFTGATSAFTCDFVYNYSEIDEFDITFNITGNTDYTGYTGYFCYNLIPRSSIEFEKEYLDGTNIAYSNCISYSGITGGSITETITKVVDLPIKDEEYFIKTYDKFTTKECNIGEEINTFTLTTQSRDFDYEKDWYFVTTKNPTKPSLGFGGLDLRDFSSLVTERIILGNEINGGNLVPGTSINTFRIKGKALNNKILVYVNGINLTEALDYRVYPGGVVQFLRGSIELNRDVVYAVYLNVPSDILDIVNDNENILNQDAFVVTGTTTGVTESDINIVNYNPTKNRYEIFLTDAPTSDSDIYLVVNGVTLGYNSEYFLSTSTPNKLILDPSVMLKNGDVITSLYFVGIVSVQGHLGYLKTETPEITWTIEDESILSENGKFLIQVTTEDDTGFINPVQSKFVDYNLGVISYSEELDPLGITISNYIYRVCFYKDYNILLENTITTRNCSDIGSFSLNINYINNKY